MGAGVADATLLLKNVESEGRALTLQNVYIAVGNTQGIDVMRCFDGGETRQPLRQFPRIRPSPKSP